MRHTRTAAIAAAAAAVLALTACGAEPSQGSAERAPKASANEPADADNADASDDEEEEPDADLPDTELSVGDSFKYDDGVKFTVTVISEITKFGEYDERPEAGQTAFRVHWDINNGSKKFVDLDGWGYNAKGATTGGDADFGIVELGSKEMSGRLAVGKTGSYTSEYVLDKEDGKKVVFTVTRMDEEFDLLAEDPNWTGTIK